MEINHLDWEAVLNLLEKGELRAAQKNPQTHQWEANLAVKKAILEAFKAGKNTDFTGLYQGFVDKHNLPPQTFTAEKGVRMVPGGSSVRRGAYCAKGVIIMPPSYINIGAYVDEGTMVDSHVLVGSCAQIGKRVHLSAGVQIGGVLEPIGLAPVIIGDDAFIGAGSMIVEGIQVGEKAVIAPGVILSKALPIYDLVHETILPKGSAIPKGAVVVSGTRALNTKSDFCQKEGLALYCPMIVKYRDEKSDASLNLEDLLR